MKGPSAQPVADYFIWLAAHECESDPDYLTPLKLQKLLYFAQGWALAEWGRALFEDRIEAWRDGPVVPAVFDQYKGFNRPITEVPAAPPSGLTDAERALIHAVWDAYKGYSAFALRDMTHEERPYKDAYRPQDHDGRGWRPIEEAAIQRSFVERSAQSKEWLRRNRDRLAARAVGRGTNGRGGAGG